MTCSYALLAIVHGSLHIHALSSLCMIQVVVNHLRSTGKVSTLGLWGRSMGAVTTLLYSNRDPSIAGIVSVELSRWVQLFAKQVIETEIIIPHTAVYPSMNSFIKVIIPFLFLPSSRLSTAPSAS